jgi:hypothetical protein
MNVVDHNLLATDWKERNYAVSATFMEDWSGKSLNAAM